MKILRLISVADPDRQIKGGPEISGGVGTGRTPKNFFLALRASVWSKGEGWATLLDLLLNMVYYHQ